MTARVDRSFPVDPSSVSEARRALDELGDRVPGDTLDTARLLISELVTNAVRHGPPGDGRGSVEVTVDHDGTWLRVEVRDAGAGFVPPSAAREVGGWGLMLVDELSSRWGIAEGAPTRVWFELDARARDGWGPGIDPLLLDTERAAVIATDRAGAETRCNRHASELFGWSGPEALGRDVVDLIVPSGDRRSADSIRARLRTGGVWDGDWLAARRDGSKVWVRVAVSPVVDDAGGLLGAVAVCVDVGERRSAERALVRSEERLRIALESGRMGTWDWDVGAGGVRWSESLERIHGIEPGSFGGTFDDFQADIHPEDRARVLGSIERALQEGAEYALDYRIVRPSDGDVRWLSVRGRVLRDEDGRPTAMVGVCADITERKEAERSLAVQYGVTRVLAASTTLSEATTELLASIGEALGWEVGCVWTPGDEDAALRLAGAWRASDAVGERFLADSAARSFPRGEGLPGRIWAAGGPIWVDDLSADAAYPRAGVATADGLHAAFGFPITLGTEVLGVVEFFSRRIRQPDEALLELMRSIGGQIGQFAERAETQADLERAHERVAFLADASVVLTRTLDPADAMRALARLVVPRLADWCAVDVVQPDGSIAAVTVAHVDPAKVRLAEEFRARFPSRVGDGGAVDQVVSNGVPVLVAEIAPEMLETLDAERRAFLEELGLRSVMLVPLSARGNTIGAITFASAESGRRFTQEDLDLAHDLARRAALAYDNARLYEERSHIARTLQRTLLPKELPDPEGLEVVALYQPSSLSHTEVGGDFYDLFETVDGAWSVVIGDVCGKGVEAAALTGMARHALRASGSRGGPPIEALEDLNRVMLREDGERFCTVAVGRIRPNGVGVHLDVACGGHPAPLIVRTDGRVEPVGAPGSLLGVFEDVAFEERSTELLPGDLAVFYTDGLIDARATAALDERALADLVAGAAGRSAAEAVELISRSVSDPDAHTSDDTCVLVVRVTG